MGLVGWAGDSRVEIFSISDLGNFKVFFSFWRKCR